MHLTKGMRVQAEVWAAQPQGTVSLAGVQPKLAATRRVVEGVVTHIRGDHPTQAIRVGVWVKTDAGEEVVVRPENILDVLPEKAAPSEVLEINGHQQPAGS